MNLNVPKYPIKSFLAITFRFDGFFPYLSPSNEQSDNVRCQVGENEDMVIRYDQDGFLSLTAHVHGLSWAVGVSVL